MRSSKDLPPPLSQASPTSPPSSLFYFPPPQKHIHTSLRQLSLMLSSSIPIAQSLALLAQNTPHKKLKFVFKSILTSLENGMSLFDAFSPYRRIFGDLTLAMIDAGSRSGKLAEALGLLLEELERKEKNTKALKKALFYPCIVLFCTLACCAFILIAVIPNFAPLFAHHSLPLPSSTQFLLMLSHILQNYPLQIYGSILAFGVLLWIALKKSHQDIFLFLPWIGKILKSTQLQHYCFSLHILLSSGVPLLQAHIFAKNTLSSPKISQALTLTQEALQNGKSLAHALQESALFAPLDLSLLHIAQQSAKVEEALAFLSREYQLLVQERVERTLACIEPLLTLFLGGFILLLALGIFMPIWEMGL